MVKRKDNTVHDDVEITSESSGDHIAGEVDTVELEDRLDAKLKQCKQELQASKHEQQQLQDELQRHRADFLNARKRLESDHAIAIDRTINSCLLDILPLCDSFQMAMSNTESWNQVEETWRKGVEGIHAQLLALLQKYQVEKLDPHNELFDPNVHEAVGSIAASEGVDAGVVQQVVLSGYVPQVNDQPELLRPARVIVAE